MTRSLALVFAAASLAVGACAVDDDALGTVNLALTGQSPSGTQYRLRHAQLTIAGSGAMQVFDTENAPDQPKISTHLPVGSYTVELAPAWSLERVNADGTAVTVEATLLSANPLPFDVFSGMLTPVVLRFQAGADQVGMGDGDVDISIGVDDPPTTPPTIVAGTTNVALGEGNTFALSVQLSSAPAGQVLVQVTSSDSSVAIAAPSTLVFNAVNWNAPQMVTVTGVQDADLLDESATLMLESPGVASATIAVTVLDDDQQQLVVTPSSLHLTEGATAVVQVALASPPPGTTTVTLSSSDPSRLTISPSVLTFTPANWNLPKVANVSALPDPDAIDSTVTITVSSAGVPPLAIPVTVHEAH